MSFHKDALPEDVVMLEKFWEVEKDFHKKIGEIMDYLSKNNVCVNCGRRMKKLDECSWCCECTSDRALMKGRKTNDKRTIHNN